MRLLGHIFLRKIMMKQPIILAALLTLSLQSAFAAMPGNWPKMKPGLIETNMQSNGKAMPTMRTCITEAQMKESEKMAADYENKCTNQKYKQSGNTHYMEMTCKDENGKPVLTKTEVTVVSPNEFRMKSDSVHNGKPMHMENTMKRVGNCTAKESAMPMGPDGKPMDIKKMMEEMKKLQQQRQ
jgi:hypothetical protein